MKTIAIIFLMFLGLVSCRQSENGKDDHPYNTSETGTEKVPEGGVSYGSDGDAETRTANTDITQQDTLNDTTRKFPPPSERNEVTPPEVTKPN